MGMAEKVGFVGDGGIDAKFDQGERALQQRQGRGDIAKLELCVADDSPGFGMGPRQPQLVVRRQSFESRDRLFGKGDAGFKVPPDQHGSGRHAERTPEERIVAQPTRGGE